MEHCNTSLDNDTVWCAFLNACDDTDSIPGEQLACLLPLFVAVVELTVC